MDNSISNKNVFDVVVFDTPFSITYRSDYNPLLLIELKNNEVYVNYMRCVKHFNIVFDF